MTGQDDGSVGLARLRARTREATPARIFTGRADYGYRTADLLRLRADHAAARDAVHARLDLDQTALADVTREFGLFTVDSRADLPRTHLLRPDLGRRLSDDARELVRQRCPPAADLQIVLGDGLSAHAVDTQAPALLRALVSGAHARGWRVGQPFAVRHCRVGILNDVGDLLRPTVVVLLIGERPGLASADSLSAYLALRPRRRHNDSDRNLVSNIRADGTPPRAAAERVLGLAEQMRRTGRSGVALAEPALEGE